MDAFCMVDAALTRGAVPSTALASPLSAPVFYKSRLGQSDGEVVGVIAAAQPALPGDRELPAGAENDLRRSLRLSRSPRSPAAMGS